MDVGDKVEKVGGDYTFAGVVVAKFPKLSGAIRYVVEEDRGILHIYSEKNLRIRGEIETEAGATPAKNDPGEPIDLYSLGAKAQRLVSGLGARTWTELADRDFRDALKARFIGVAPYVELAKGLAERGMTFRDCPYAEKGEAELQRWRKRIREVDGFPRGVTP